MPADTIPSPPSLRYTPDRPVVLYTDFPPDAAGGASVIINGLLTDEEKKSVLRVSPSPPEKPGSFNDYPYVTLKSGSFGRSQERSRSWFWDMFRHAGALAAETAAVAKARNAGRVWVVLHQSGVPVAEKLAGVHKLPIHAGVNDDPPYATILRSRQAFALSPWVARSFRKALQASATVDTTSQPMADRYLKKYGVSSVLTHRGLKTIGGAKSTFSRSGGELSVGILGNTYQYGQLPLLLQAVGLAAKQLGVKGKIVVVGRGYGERLRKQAEGTPVTVQFHNHLPEQEGIQQIAACTAAYLNYPFGRLHRVLVETSFPVKLSTYLQATRPVLFHGPGGTSITGPLAVSDGGIHHWSDLDPESGAKILTQMWENSAIDQPWIGELVRAKYYDHFTYRNNLIEALNRQF